MIRFENVTKRFGDLVALSNVCTDFASGTTNVIIGPSGCGKSTMLRCIVGLELPDSGQLTVENVRLRRDSVREIRSKLGYVIQEGGLFPHMTARENLTLMARRARWATDRIADREATLAELVNLPPNALDRYPSELSGGQRQRVALMRALFMDPKVLLLDEPLAALDPIIRYELRRDLREIFRRLRKTVVLVTHDLDEAAFFADTVTLLRNGSLVQHGIFEDLVREPSGEFVTRFLNAQRSSWSDHLGDIP